MAKAISQRKLDDLRREWQKTLRLQDWKITSKLVTAVELGEEDDAVGRNYINLNAKHANIQVLAPEAADEERLERSKDVEDTLVHELIHCHFQPFWTDKEPMCTLQEQAIETLTGALLQLKRKKNG